MIADPKLDSLAVFGGPPAFSEKLHVGRPNIGDRRRFSFDKSLSNLEKTLIERALREVSANQSHAAEILNLSEANLRYRMKKFKIRSGV